MSNLTQQNKPSPTVSLPPIEMVSLPPSDTRQVDRAWNAVENGKLYISERTKSQNAVRAANRELIKVTRGWNPKADSVSSQVIERVQNEAKVRYPQEFGREKTDGIIGNKTAAMIKRLAADGVIIDLSTPGSKLAAQVPPVPGSAELKLPDTASRPQPDLNKGMCDKETPDMGSKTNYLSLRDVENYTDLQGLTGKSTSLDDRFVVEQYAQDLFGQGKYNVKIIQRAAGLPATGIADERTRQALENFHKRMIQDPIKAVANGLAYVKPGCSDRTQSAARYLLRNVKGFSNESVQGDNLFSEIARFQKENKLTVDGIIGSQTMKALLEQSKGNGRNPLPPKELAALIDTAKQIRNDEFFAAGYLGLEFDNSDPLFPRETTVLQQMMHALGMGPYGERGVFTTTMREDVSRIQKHNLDMVFDPKLCFPRQKDDILGLSGVVDQKTFDLLIAELEKRQRLHKQYSSLSLSMF